MPNDPPEPPDAAADPKRRLALAALAGAGLGAPIGAVAARSGAPAVLPISDAIRRQAGGDTSARLSWLSFLPANRRAAILDHSDKGDLSEPLQAMVDALPAGASVHIPGRVNLERGLTVSRSLTLYGDPGRENFDNSWDRSGGGSQIAFRGQKGDALTVRAEGSANANMNVILRDFAVRGNRLDDAGRRNPRALGGRGVAVLGSDEHTSNIRLVIDNVHVAQAVEEGLHLSGAVYGGSITDMFLHRNGRAGFSAVGGPVGIGEMWLARLRAFQNGEEGRSDLERGGFVWRAGTFAAGQISASENYGPGAMIGGGPFSIGQLQLESNGRGGRDGDRRQLVLGLPGAGVLAGGVDALMSAPGSSGGVHVHLAANAQNVRLGGYLSDAAERGGVHLLRERGSTGLDVTGLNGLARIVDRSDDHRTRISVEVFARASAATEQQTGDGAVAAWRPDSPIINDFSAYDPRTGVFTAPIAALYAVEVVIPLEAIGDAHQDARMTFDSTSYGRVFDAGNVAQRRGIKSRALSLSASGRVPMKQGDTLRVTYAVDGGPRSVGTAGGNLRGFLTIRAGG